MKTQGLAIALVLSAGVAMFVMYHTAFASLRDAQTAYYQEQRFADVFASLKRAPLRLTTAIAEIPGVSVVAPRVVADITLDVAGLDEPATGRLIGVPADRRPALNDVFLSRGRWIEPGRPDEILASEGFVTANGLTPGDRIGALINGRFRRLTIVGVALSPEYVYSVRPGELVPDDRRFGILWMNERALSTAMDMEGAFNDVSLALARGASLDDVMARLDPLLQPFGGRGAMPRAIQISHWTLENELTLLQEVGVLLPLIFLGVAALVLNVALVRMLTLQRQQIAALKALGYGNAAIGWHYIKWALVIGLSGVAIGIGSGMVLAGALLDTYNVLFRFPDLQFVLPLPVIATVTALTMLATIAGAASAVARAVRIAPAEAMRPAAPLLYGRSVLEFPALARGLSGTARMVLRNISRFPARTLASVMGIALAVSIMMIGLVFGDAIEQLIATQFWVAARQDVTVNFVEPRSARVRHELARLPGVLAVEPQRVVAARIRFGHRERHLAVTGVTVGSRLRQIVNRDRSAIALPASGVVLSKPLATALAAAKGDEVIVDVLEGARPTHRATVTAVVDDLIGLSVYMDLDQLHDLMREGDSVSGALLSVDAARAAGLSAALKQLPAVAGVGFKRAELAGFRDTMAAALDLTITVNVLFAGIIAFGVVYNAARISLSERARELASLRVLGFTRAEIKSVLLGELSLLTLAALPVGAMLGYVLAGGIIASLDSEVYRVPFHVSRQTVAGSCLSVIAAAVFSGLLVARRLDTLDLAAVLSVRD